MYIKFTDHNGSQREIRGEAVSTLNFYRGKGRPRASDYLINDLTPKERTRLRRIVREHEKKKELLIKKVERLEKASAFVWKANAYIYTVVIGLIMLNVLADQMSKIRI